MGCSVPLSVFQVELWAVHVPLQPRDVYLGHRSRRAVACELPTGWMGAAEERRKGKRGKNDLGRHLNWKRWITKTRARYGGDGTNGYTI